MNSDAHSNEARCLLKWSKMFTQMMQDTYSNEARCLLKWSKMLIQMKQDAYSNKSWRSPSPPQESWAESWPLWGCWASLCVAVDCWNVATPGRTYAATCTHTHRVLLYGVHSTHQRATHKLEMLLKPCFTLSKKLHNFVQNWLSKLKTDKLFAAKVTFKLIYFNI
jgi:hypothetical protein